MTKDRRSLADRELNIQIVAHEAIEEWRRAVAKHGDNSPDSFNTTNINRLATLGEEFGEVCRLATLGEEFDEVCMTFTYDKEIMPVI